MENEWTFVITVDGAGASAAVRGEADPIPLLGIVDATGFRHTFAEPTVNVSVALGSSSIPLTGTTPDGATTTYPVTIVDQTSLVTTGAGTVGTDGPARYWWSGVEDAAGGGRWVDPAVPDDVVLQA